MAKSATRWSMVILLVTVITPWGATAAAEELGRLSANPYQADSTSNPYGGGSSFRADGVNNPSSRFGNPYGTHSTANPHATDTPKLFDSKGRYRGKLSSNPHDPESISNPYGRYGSRYSPDSINNPYGAGSRYRADSPNNPYGSGWTIETE